MNRKNVITIHTGIEGMKYLEEVVKQLNEIERRKVGLSKKEKDKMYPKNTLGG